MEPIFKSIRENIRYANIYRDDIEEIFALLSQNDRVVVISTDRHKMQSLEELFTLNQDIIPALKIFASNATYDFIYVDVDKNGALVFSSSDRPDFSGLFYTLLNTVKSREIKFLRICSSPTAWFLISVGGSILALLMSFNRPLYCTFIAYGIYFTIMITYAILGIRLRTWCVINLKYRKDTTNWWKDNRDKLILMVITALVAGTIGALITFAARKLLPP